MTHLRRPVQPTGSRQIIKLGSTSSRSYYCLGPRRQLPRQNLRGRWAAAPGAPGVGVKGGRHPATQQYPRPVVILTLDGEWTAEGISRTIDCFLTRDDVFSREFLADTLVVQFSGGGNSDNAWLGMAHCEIPAGEKHAGWHPVEIWTYETDEQNRLPDGPYFSAGGAGELAEAWRLYPDTQDAFYYTMVPSASDPFRFEPLNCTSDDGLYRLAAVPSRLYAARTPDRPLDGRRIAVKDLFRVAGVKTTLGNRAFAELYGPEEENAAYVDVLVRLGAVLVGKTKMCSFAAGDRATGEWVDFHAPFNPRADGYWEPSGSSTGAGAAEASYDWIDWSVGTDTTGSIRKPAMVYGLFGLRPTWDPAAIEGAYLSCRLMDTVGLLTRSIAGLGDLLSHSFPGLPGSTAAMPGRILWCTDVPDQADETYRAAVDGFAGLLEQVLGVERTRFGLADEWARSPPPEAQGRDLKTYIARSAEFCFFRDGYDLSDKFRRDYGSAFGKPPYVSPPVRWAWARGARVTSEQYARGCEELLVFRRWFSERVARAAPGGGTDTVLLLPGGGIEKPQYRDESPPPLEVLDALHPLNIACSLGIPHLVVPVGQQPFRAHISQQTEYLPMAASMLGAAGSDLLLVKLAQLALEKGGKATEVLTGRNMLEP